MPKPEQFGETSNGGPIGRLGWIQVSAADPERIAAFWAEVIGVRVDVASATRPST